MKTLKIILLCLLPSFAFAGTTESISVRSAGKLIADDSINLSQQLELSPTIKLQKPSSSRGADLSLRESNRITITYTDPVQFDLFDAWVDLSGDLDQDGYYHNIKVSFDADVNTPTTEAVYAKIYLSYQGGPWFPLSTTDLFEIHGNSADDSFEIINELEQGFEPGDYEVLIELHSLYHSGIVSERIVQLDRSGYLITLEDLDHDQPPYTVTYVDSYGYSVSGSFSGAGLLLLGLLTLLKFRFSKRQ
jgi:hypothetical protein